MSTSPTRAPWLHATRSSLRALSCALSAPSYLSLLLQLMREGDKWQLVVPAELAYGGHGTGSIGPGATLLFDIELLKVFEDSAPRVYPGSSFFESVCGKKGGKEYHPARVCVCVGGGPAHWPSQHHSPPRKIRDELYVIVAR